MSNVKDAAARLGMRFRPNGLQSKSVSIGIALCILTGAMTRVDAQDVVTPIAPKQASQATASSAPASAIETLTNFAHSDHSLAPRLVVTEGTGFALSYRMYPTFHFHVWDITTNRKLVDVSAEQMVARQTGPGKKVTLADVGRTNQAAMSNNARFVLAGFNSNSLLYDTTLQKTIGVYKGTFGTSSFNEHLRYTPFSDDGTLVGLCDGYDFRVYSTTLHQVVATFDDVEPERIEFSPDNSLLLAEGHLAVWLIDLKTKSVLKRFKRSMLPQRDRAFSADSTRFSLVVVPPDEGTIQPDDGGVTVFDRTGDMKRHFHLAGDLHSTVIRFNAALSPEGDMLMLVFPGAWGRIWDLNSGRVVRDLPKDTSFAQFGRDNVLLATGHSASERENSIDEWRHWFTVTNMESGKQLDRKQTYRQESAGQIQATPADGIFTVDGRGWIVRYTSAGALFWPKLEDEGRTVSFHTEGIREPLLLCFSDSGHRLAIAHDGVVSTNATEGVTFWDFRLGIPVGMINNGQHSALFRSRQGQLCFSPNAKYVHTTRKMGYTLSRIGSSQPAIGTIARADDIQGSPSTLINLPAGEMLASRFSNDNKRLLVVAKMRGEDDEFHDNRFAVAIYDSATRKELQRYEGSAEGITEIWSAAVSPSGRYVVTLPRLGYKDQALLIWDLENWTESPKPVRLTPNRIGSIPDNPVFVSDEELWLHNAYGLAKLDLKSERLEHFTFDRKSGSNASHRAFAPHKNLAAIITDDNSLGGRALAISDLQKQEFICQMPHTTAEQVGCSPDGRFVVVAASDRWNEIRRADNLELVCRFVQTTTSGEWIVVTPEGLFDGSYTARQQVMFRVGEGLNVVPVDRFFQDFYYPGLLASIWRGERPRPSVVLGEQLPPLLTIDSPALRGERDERHVTLMVTATDQGGGIRGPSLKHNGARLIGSVQSTERIPGGVKRTFAVDLIEGENSLEVVSASADGSFESDPVRVVLRYNKRLPKSRLHVLVVGVNEYGSRELKLNYALRDAEQIAEVFSVRGGALYADVNLISLRDADASASAILRAIERLSHEAEPQDTVVVFLSGHGSLVDKGFYFLPHDFRRDGESLESDIRRYGLPAAMVGDALAQVPALKRMIVFDTGQSGSALPVSPSSRNAFSFRGAVERLGRAQGAFTIAAFSVSSKAEEVADLKHGILSYSLLAGLNAVDGGPLADQWVEPSGSDNVAHALELFSFASSHARQLGKHYFGQEQDVQYSSSGMTFPVLPMLTARSDRVDQRVSRNATEKPQQLAPEAEDEKMLSGATAETTLHVITVGINNYQQSSLNLRHAAPDASAIGKLLVTRGKAAFGRVELTSLLDGQATRAGILETVTTVSQKAKPGDTLAVFLAGHGSMVGQRYYFIPHEFTLDGEETTDAIRNQGLAADALGDVISQVPARQRILIFDTCASGGAIHLNRKGADPFAFRGAIEQLDRLGGTFTLAGASSTEEAQEVEELGHGILSYALLAAARAVETGPLRDRPLEPAAAGGIADVLEWFSYAAGNVPRLTKQYFGTEQQVQLGGVGKAFPILSVYNAAAKQEP